MANLHQDSFVALIVGLFDTVEFFKAKVIPLRKKF